MELERASCLLGAPCRRAALQEEPHTEAHPQFPHLAASAGSGRKTSALFRVDVTPASPFTPIALRPAATLFDPSFPRMTCSANLVSFIVLWSLGWAALWAAPSGWDVDNGGPGLHGSAPWRGGPSGGFQALLRPAPARAAGLCWLQDVCWRLYWLREESALSRSYSMHAAALAPPPPSSAFHLLQQLLPFGQRRRTCPFT